MPALRLQIPQVLLEQIVPHLHGLLADPIATVRATALRVLASVLENIDTFPASETKLFCDYLFPQVSALTGDSEACVVLALAETVADIAEAAARIGADAPEGMHHTLLGDILPRRPPPVSRRRQRWGRWGIC